MSEKKTDIQESITPETEEESTLEMEFKTHKISEPKRTAFTQIKYRGQYCSTLIGLLVLRTDMPALIKATDFLLNLVNSKEVKEND